MLVPKLVTTLKGYTKQEFTQDLTAGVIVGIVALPLAIAFAIASGVPPERGLYTAIIAGFIISALGGSRVQIGGPTGAFVVIVAGVLHQYGMDGLMVATLLAGVMLILFGVARLGAALKFIPHPVIIGFTSGIAVIIFSTQVRDALGLTMESVPASFLGSWQAYASHLGTVNPWAVGVTAATLAILIFWPRLSLKIPAPFIALIVTTAAATVFDLPVETIGSRFGGINAGLPVPSLPHIELSKLPVLVVPAFTIALLAAVESLLSAVVADGMVGGRHRSNMELVAQGVANIASPLFGGIPATGAVARTATNVKSGGRTPVAGMVHAVTLLLITLFLGKWAALIPLATLAGILVIVAYHMSEWRTFVGDLSAPRSDVTVMLTTFLLTILVDLTVAIEVGMVLAAFLFMKRMADVTDVQVITEEFAEPQGAKSSTEGAIFKRTVPAGVEVYEINGPFFFGAAETFRSTMRQVARKPRALVIRMRNVPAMDATGMHVLKEMLQQVRRDGTQVILSEVQEQPLRALTKSGLLEVIGEGHVVPTIDEALQLAT